LGKKLQNGLWSARNISDGKNFSIRRSYRTGIDWPDGNLLQTLLWKGFPHGETRDPLLARQRRNNKASLALRRSKPAKKGDPSDSNAVGCGRMRVGFLPTQL
jgi:hypothetical protein